jgi:hypothetical protein
MAEKKEANRIRLTKAVIDAATYRGQAGERWVLWDTKLTGFGLRVFPSGKKSFVLSYRAGGIKRLLTIGRYGVLALDEARKAARAELGKVQTQQSDPVKERREQRAQDAATGTLRELLNLYLLTLKLTDQASGETVDTRASR